VVARNEYVVARNEYVVARNEYVVARNEYQLILDNSYPLRDNLKRGCESLQTSPNLSTTGATKVFWPSEFLSLFTTR
jgi:hypothetical protein